MTDFDPLRPLALMLAWRDDHSLIALPLAALGIGLCGMVIYVFAANLGSHTFLCGQNSDWLKRLFVALGVGGTGLVSAAALLGWRPALKLPVQLVACWLLVAILAVWLVPLIPDCPIID